MDKARLFGGEILVAPIMWMWIDIFVFHEVAWLITLVVYLLILISLADGILNNKTTKIDKEVQTERDCVKEQSTQTEDFLISAIKSEEKEEVTEMESDVSELREGDQTLTAEINKMEDEIVPIEEESITEIENDSDSLALPKIPLFPLEARLEAVREVCEKMKTKYLVPTIPNLSIDDREPMKSDKVAEADQQCNKEKHEGKKLPFLQRKLRKVKKRFMN